MIRGYRRCALSAVTALVITGSAISGCSNNNKQVAHKPVNIEQEIRKVQNNPNIPESAKAAVITSIYQSAVQNVKKGR